MDDLEPTQTFRLEDDTLEESRPGFLGRIAQMRENIAANMATFDYEVPGYSGYVWLRLKRVPFDQVRQIMRRVEARAQGKEKNLAELDGMCDVIGIATVEILGRENNNFIGMDPDEGVPLTFTTARVGVVFDFQVNSLRDAVKGVFANDYAILDCYGAYSNWLTGKNQDDLPEALREKTLEEVTAGE